MYPIYLKGYNANSTLSFIATLYLFFDLEQIRQTVEGNYPKEYEWMASFGISFTLIWLYVEILRLVVIVFARHDN